MKTKHTLFFIGLVLLTCLNNAFALDCTLKNARVTRSFKYPQNNTTYFWVGNLNKQIQIPITESSINTELAKVLRSSDKNKDVFININLDSSVCAQVMNALDHQSFLIYPKFIKSTNIAYSSSIDCVECVNLKNAPVSIQLPSMTNIKKILDKSAGFSTENIDLASILLVHLFERMNNKTPNANSLIFTVSLFKALEALKVKSMNKDQLQYLALRFQEQLPKDQHALMQKLFKQIAGINFKRDNSGHVSVLLATIGGKTISLNGNDIPAANQESRKMINKYFNKVEIENGTSMVFTNKSIKETLKSKKTKGLNELEIQSFVAPSTVSVQGIKIFGQFPVIGGVSIKPQEFIVDIDSSIPVKANVGFKKGFIGMSYTFDLDN